MKIVDAQFIISAVREDQFPKDGLPEIALIGRSNVGKSSLINTLIERKNLARTSSQPGKTQMLNYYRVRTSDHGLYFVDFPGYGYAKVSKKQREQWGKLAEQYLLKRKSLVCILQLVDLRHPPTADDRAMVEWLEYYDLPYCIVMTKADKVPRGKWDKHKKIAREAFNLQHERPYILFSSETRMGREELWSHIYNRIEFSAQTAQNK